VGRRNLYQSPHPLSPFLSLFSSPASRSSRRKGSLIFTIFSLAWNCRRQASLTLPSRWPFHFLILDSRMGATFFPRPEPR
jgi:hypothetical protein